ncbi:MAG: LysR family transcriptional regulator [Minwuiales bacterium]|nr:LysR family transcriptional regulator [Minwuiales bacterium]
MELKWLEDMLLLLETGSFSKAAKRRNVTQPAFSRRIRSLETWLGADLVDRSRNPLQFTKAARANEAAIRQIVNSFYELRSRMRVEARSEHPVVFTAQHTLTITHLPRLLRLVEALRPRISYRVRSANRDDCVTHMVRGQAEFLLCYESATEENARPAIAARRTVIGPENLVPVTGSNDKGRPIHLPREGATLPLLLYPEDVFLGRVQRNEHLPALIKTVNVETICESAFSAGLKEMAVNGMGIAWLPASLIDAELKAGQLHSLEAHLGRCPMEVVLYATANASSADSERAWQIMQKSPKPD